MNLKEAEKFANRAELNQWIDNGNKTSGNYHRGSSVPIADGSP